MPAELCKKVAPLLTWQAMATIAASAAVMVGVQFVPVLDGVVDVVAGGLLWLTVGADALKAMAGYYNFYKYASNARTDAELDRAAKSFAQATINTVSAIGWARFSRWMGKGGRATRAAVIENDTAQLARWAKFIEGIHFKVPPNRGMLWSSVGGFRPAQRLAEAKGLVTLEMSLEETGFQELMHNEYGLYKDQSPAVREITGKIWRMVSQRYARSLEGKVSAFVHRTTHFAKTEAAATARLNQEPTAGSLQDVRKMINPNDPILVNEIAEIRAMMQGNTKVTELTLIDVETGDAFGHVTPEILESLKRLENRPVDRLSHLGPPNE